MRQITTPRHIRDLKATVEPVPVLVLRRANVPHGQAERPEPGLGKLLEVVEGGVEVLARLGGVAQPLEDHRVGALGQQPDPVFGVLDDDGHPLARRRELDDVEHLGCY